MAHKVFSAGAGQAVTTDGIYIKLAKLTAGSAQCDAIIYSNGTPMYYLAAPAHSSDFVPAVAGGNEFSIAIPGPITVDVVGTGAHLTLDY